jgi:Flp pilus assembly protein CpaB
MKSKTMILMAVAVVCGLGASYMTSRLIAERNETVTVLVAKQKLPQWTLVKDPAKMFEPKETLKTDAPKTAVFSMEELKDRILIRGVSQGQAVVMEDLQDKNKNSLDTQITPGMRAIAIKAEASSAVGGFVLPGSHVDIIHVGRYNDHVESRLLLQRILVRAIDLLPVRPDDRSGMVPTTVTLEVTPEQALMLAAVRDGNLTLSLRSVTDNAELNVAAPLPKPPPPPPPALSQLAQLLPKVPAMKPVKPDPVDRSTLTVFNGANWTRATFITRKGETTTEIESSSPSDNRAPVVPAPTPPSFAPKTDVNVNTPAGPAPGLPKKSA